MNTSQKPRSKERGFRIVKILVGVVIIGVLAIVVMQFVFADQDGRGLLERVKADFSTIESAIDRYLQHKGRLPEDLHDLTIEDHKGDKYLKRLPSDPFGNDYEYEIYGNNKFLIRSWGFDGEPDTDDDIANRNMANLAK